LVLCSVFYIRILPTVRFYALNLKLTRIIFQNLHFRKMAFNINTAAMRKSFKNNHCKIEMNEI